MDAFWIRLCPRNLREWVSGKLELQAILGNSGWMASERLARLALGMPVTILIARHLGPESFGLLSYTIAFVAIFAAFATAGLDKIVVREISNGQRIGGDVLGTAFVVRLVLASTALAAAYVSSALTQGDPLAPWLVLIISAGMLFQATDVIDYWNQAHLQSRYTVMAKLIGFAVASLVRIGLVVTGAGVAAFAVAITVEVALGACVLMASHVRRTKNLINYRATIAGAKFLLQESWPLLFAALAVTLYMRVDMIMLHSMAGAKEAGIYAAATRISEAFYAIPVILGASIFPLIIRLREQDRTRYFLRIRQMYSSFFWVAILITIPLWIVADRSILFLYGESFASAGPVLAVHVVGTVPVFLGVASSHFLIAERMQMISMYRTVIGLIANFALNLILIPMHGAMGAAIATVISYFIATFSVALFPASRVQAWHLLASPIPKKDWT